MKRDDALAILRAHEADPKRLGVLSLHMFGSTAREEATEESDVDLFFDHERGKLGLFQLMNLKEYTTHILGREVDLMTRDGIHQMLRERIEKSAVQVF